MVKWCKLVPLFLFLMLLSGCANPFRATTNEIIPPAYTVCPLEGKWEVIEVLESSGENVESDSYGVGDFAQFTGSVALYGGYVWNDPLYRIKKVNPADYLMTKYCSIPSTIVPRDDVEVITVYSASNFWGEFMKIDEEQMISFAYDKILLLKRISDQVDPSLTAGNSEVYRSDNGENLGTSGVFIGLRIPTGDGYTYKTLWVASENKKLHPILMRHDIFFPRSSGFWELQVNDSSAEGSVAEVFSAHNVGTKVLDSQGSKSIISRQARLVEVKNVIHYIGNDYMAVEKIIKNAGLLQVLPVDNLSAGKGIKLSDLVGDNGAKAYYSAREQAIQNLRNQGINWLDEQGSEENFGLMRKNGHWYLIGNINYQEGGEFKTMEYTINLIPPSNLIFFDTLYVRWQNIKDRVPDAVDAFTSPNKDIALVRTKTRLYVYGITVEELDSRPLAEIKLEEGAAIIMAEWATGSYVSNWEKAFLANGAKVME